MSQSSTKLILVLEDNDERIVAFKDAIESLGDFRLHLWKSAVAMLTDLPELLSDAVLISLDHDLNPESESAPDPGTGLEVCEFLATRPSCCPVILHTSNHERVWSMHNELRFAGWTAERVGPLGDKWIHTSWLPTAARLLEKGRQ